MQVNVSCRKPFPTDVSDEKWAFVVSCLVLLPAAAGHITLEVVALADARRGFVLLPWRWAVEHSFAWASRFRRLARDYGRLPEILAGLHFVAFAGLMLHRAIMLCTSSSQALGGTQLLQSGPNCSASLLDQFDHRRCDGGRIGIVRKPGQETSSP